MDYGPFDLTHSEAPRRIRIGIVGSVATGEGVARWIERCCAGLPAKASRQPNLFPAFPGLGSDGAKGLSFSTMLGKISWVCPKGAATSLPARMETQTWAILTAVSSGTS
jgi:hypothetical protein